MAAEWWQTVDLDLASNTAQSNGLLLTGVLIFPADEAAPIAVPAMTRRRKGGRPPRDDWDLFAAEVVRVMALDAGSIGRTELRRHMKLWAGKNMDPQPNDRTIERKVDALVAASLTAD